MRTLFDEGSSANDVMFALTKLADADTDTEEETQPTEQQEHETRKEKALHNMDLWCDWITTQCTGQFPYRYSYYTRDERDIEQDDSVADSKTTSDLVALMNLTENKDVLLACRNVIRARFLKDQLK